MAYSGFYQPTNPLKYKGDPSKIVFRSSWELSAFKWLDANPDVVQWCSEEIVIPYLLEDGTRHRYFPDLWIQWKSGKVWVVEIKPERETRAPEPGKGKRRDRLIEEIQTFSKNQCKWEAAYNWCQTRGYTFQVWTEKSLEQLGIKTGVVQRRYPRKRS